MLLEIKFWHARCKTTARTPFNTAAQKRVPLRPYLLLVSGKMHNVGGGILFEPIGALPWFVRCRVADWLSLGESNNDSGPVA